jgi:hypothetical protein
LSSKKHCKISVCKKWFIDMNNDSKGQMYRIFKQTFGFECPIHKLSPKFRNIFFLNFVQIIEVRRWHGIPLCERLCSVWNSHQIADEFHYISESNLKHCMTDVKIPLREIHKITYIFSLRYRNVYMWILHCTITWKYINSLNSRCQRICKVIRNCK